MPADDQGFLGGQRHSLPGFERGEGGRQAGRPDDAHDDNIHLGVSRRGDNLRPVAAATAYKSLSSSSRSRPVL